MNKTAAEKLICLVGLRDVYVLRAAGQSVEAEFEYVGTELLGDWCFSDKVPDDATGVMVWEGVCTNAWCQNHGGDWEPDFSGKWRKATGTDLLELLESDNQEGE